MMRLLSNLLLPLALLASLHAGEAPPLPQVVYVPFDKAPELAVGKHGVMLPYEEFVRLWDAAHPEVPTPPPAGPPVRAALTTYTLDGTVHGDLAEFTLTASFSALGEGWSSVDLPAALALRDLTVSDPRMIAARTDAGVVVHLPHPGAFTLTATLAAPVTKDAAGRRSVVVVAPAAAAGRLALRIPDPGVDVAVDPAVAAITSTDQGATLLKAVLGAAPRLTISWQPPARAVAGQSLLLASQRVSFTIAERSLRCDISLDISVLRRPTAEFTLDLPAGCQLLAVEGRSLRTWEREGDRLRLLLHEPVEGSWQGVLRLEQVLPALAPGESRPLIAALPVLVGAARDTGNVDLVAGEGLALAVDGHDGLAQIDPGEIGAEQAVAAFRYLAAPPPLKLTVTRLRSELRVGLAQLVRLGEDEDLVLVHLDLDVRKAGVFALILDVPESWEPGDITGLEVDDLRSAPAAGGRKRLELALRGRLLGVAAVDLHFRAPPSIPRAGTPVASLIPGIVALPDARQVRGTLAIAAPASWAMAATARSGLIGVEVEPLRREGILAPLALELGEGTEIPLAFSFLGTGEEHPSLTLSATPRPRDLSLRQEDLLTVAEGSLRRTITWRGGVRYSPLPALRVRAPTELDNRLTFTGANLADRVAVERADGLTTWELRFQAPVLGSFTVVAEMTGELPALQPGKPDTIAVAPFLPLDTTRLEAVLAVAREGSIEVTAIATGMESVPPADLPATMQTAGLAAGFQGATPMAAELRVTRHDLVHLADGSVALAHYAAALGDDGVARVLGRLALTTRGRPWLEVRLPEGAELLEVVVGGRPGRPSRRADGAVVVPLGDRSGAVDVALVYALRLLPGKPGIFGGLRLPLPTLGSIESPLPVERTEVALYLPEELAVTTWRGDLQPLGLSQSLWQILSQRIAPAPDEERALGDPSSTGLTVGVPLHGVRHALVRLGDGGTVDLRFWRRGALDLLGLLAAVAGLVAAWFCRHRSQPLAALALLAAVTVASTGGIWLVVPAGLALGVACGLLAAGVGVILARRRERRSAPAPSQADPWAVEAPPASTSATGDGDDAKPTP